jgi:hypothetical protein
MKRVHGYEYAATISPELSPFSGSRFTVSVSTKGTTLTFPHDSPLASARGEAYDYQVMMPNWPVSLFDPPNDLDHVAVSRSGEAQNKKPELVEGMAQAAHAYQLGFPRNRMADDFTASLYVGDRVADRGQLILSAKALHLRIKGVSSPTVMRVTLVEKDGAAWSFKVFASTEWKDIIIPLGKFSKAESVMLPQGYPGSWAYWLPSPEGRTSIHISDVERIQFSLRSVDFGTIASIEPSQATVAIDTAELVF